MDAFDDRRRASEDLYIRQQERAVRLRVSRDRHLAYAVAARIGQPKAEADAYAGTLAGWKAPDGGHRDTGLSAKVLADLRAGGVEAGPDDVARMVREAQAAADRDDSGQA